MENSTKFSDWIRQRINQYGFAENQDFTSFLKIMKRGSGLSGGVKQKEYAFTIDMAKELSMVENNDKGWQARMYFIRVENALLVF